MPYFVINTETIIRGSALGKEEDIDEALKAKFLTRLVREYRRNLEYQKREHIKEATEQEI